METLTKRKTGGVTEKSQLLEKTQGGSREGYGKGSVAVTVAERLKQARKAKGIDLFEAGELLEACSCTVWSYEVGKTEPRVSYLEKATRVYGVRLEWLLGLEVT